MNWNWLHKRLARFRPAGASAEPKPRWEQALEHHTTFWRHCFRRLNVNNAMAMAAALSYRTIFALIPLIVLAFLVLKATGVVENSKRSLHQMMKAAGLTQIEIHPAEAPRHLPVGLSATRPAPQPTAGAASRPATAAASSQPTTAGAARPVRPLNVGDWVESLVTRVEAKLTFRSLGPIGMVLMVWTAMTLLMTAERSLNRIFGAPRSRPLVVRVLLYWSAITFVPVVLVAAGYLGTMALHAARQTPVLDTLAFLLDFFGNLIVGVLAVACVYKFIPNTHVRTQAAFAGALTAVPLWILARWGFGLYVTMVVGRGSLYGALGLLPLFLLWVYVSWYFFLLGAEVAHTWANLRQMIALEQSEGVLLGPVELLAAAAIIVARYVHHEGGAPFEQIAADLGLPDESTRRLIEKLQEGGVVLPVRSSDGEAYVPARPAGQIRIRDIWNLSGPQPADQAAARQPGAPVAQALRQARSLLDQAAGETTLKDLIDRSSDATE